MPAIKNEVKAEVVELPGLITIDDSLIEERWAEEQEDGDAPGTDAPDAESVRGASEPAPNSALAELAAGTQSTATPSTTKSSTATTGASARSVPICRTSLSDNKIGAMMVRAEIEFAQQMDKMRMFQQKLISARDETVSMMSEHMRTVMDWEDEVKRVKREREEDKDEAEEGPGAKKPRYHELVDKFAAEGRKEGRYEVNPILTRLDPQF